MMKDIKRRTMWPNIISCTGITKKDNHHPSTSSPKHSQISHSPETATTETLTNSEITTDDLQDSIPSFNVKNAHIPPIYDSPSSPCSPVWHTSFSPISDTFCSQSYCSPSDVGKQSASRFGKNLYSNDSSVEKKVNEFAMKTPDQDSITTARKDEQVCNQSCCSEEDDGLIYARNVRRPKPYHEFLDEIEKQELEAKEDACRKAKHMKYLDRLRQQEDCINNWEIKETSKILIQMKEKELKLAKDRIKASEKKLKEINRIQNLAAEKKSRERRSTSIKLSSADRTTDTSFLAKSLTLLKLKILK